MITTTQTTNYSLTFNNDVLVSAKDLTTGRFVKRSIAMTEYEAEMLQTAQAELLASQAVKLVAVAASKVLFSASFTASLTILFVAAFSSLLLAFFAASNGNIYAQGFIMTLIASVTCGAIGLVVADQVAETKKKLLGVIA